MSLCKTGQIVNCCHPNALMTLAEYLEDYASEKTREIGYQLIAREMEKITNHKVKETTIENIGAIRRNQKRDFYF